MLSKLPVDVLGKLFHATKDPKYVGLKKDKMPRWMQVKYKTYKTNLETLHENAGLNLTKKM